jgi:hypothetical protein
MRSAFPERGAQHGEQQTGWIAIIPLTMVASRRQRFYRRPTMVRFRVQFHPPAGTLKQTFEEARRSAFHEMLQYWHKTYLPMHFEPSAMKRYGYQPRSGDNEPPRLTVTVENFVTKKLHTYTKANPHYSWRKRRKKRHNRPLVWSGLSERIAENPSNFQIRVTKMITKGVITGLPRYFFQYHKGGMINRKTYTGRISVYMSPQPNKKQETETITNAEMSDMARVGQNRFDIFMQNWKRQAAGHSTGN